MIPEANRFKKYNSEYALVIILKRLNKVSGIIKRLFCSMIITSLLM